MSDAHIEAKNIALQLLRNVEIVTRDDIDRAVSLTLDLLQSMHPDQEINAELLLKEVEDLCNVWVPSERTLEGDDDHQEWLEATRSTIEWSFWSRYERYLEMDKGWAPA